MTGEERHERCRHGQLTAAWRVDMDGAETPGLLPLCAWQLPRESPPAAKRAWGGNAIEINDCADCPAYNPL